TQGIIEAVENVKNNLISVPTVEATIPHEVLRVHGGGRVMLRPAVAGSGVSAGGPVRAILELAGIEDIASKSLGASSAINMVRSALIGMEQLRNAEEVAKLRGKSVDELLN